jgi:lactate permease
VIVVRRWRPKRAWRFESDQASKTGGETDPSTETAAEIELSTRTVARAWMPFALLTVTVLVWGIPSIKPWGTSAVKDQLDRAGSWKPALPWLHLKVAKGRAVTGHETPQPEDLEKAQVEVVPLSSTGTAVFLAAVASGLLLGMSPARMAGLLLNTVRRMVPAITAILCMLALGFVTKYSGMDAVLGLAFTRTGPLLYPVFGTLLGWLGVALTGSDTSSNVLFGNLQRITAQNLGLNPILMAAANSTGGVMGKMIDAQSIVVATAATHDPGKEGDLLRAVFWHSISLALLVGAIVWVYAHVTPWMVVNAGSPP